MTEQLIGDLDCGLCNDRTDMIVDWNTSVFVLVRDAMPRMGHRTSARPVRHSAMPFGASPDSAILPVFLGPPIENHGFRPWSVAEVIHLGGGKISKSMINKLHTLVDDHLVFAWFVIPFLLAISKHLRISYVPAQFLFRDQPPSPAYMHGLHHFLLSFLFSVPAPYVLFFDKN
jgi:hypothetical protein